MSKVASIFVKFSIFGIVSVFLVKMVYVVGLFSGAIESFFSLFCYLGFSSSVINQISLLSSSLLLSMLVYWLVKTFFLD